MTYFVPEYHFIGLDKRPLWNNPTIKNSLAVLYNTGRNSVCEIMNFERMEQINALWDATGKPTTCGEDTENFNPEYIEHIRREINDDLVQINTDFEKKYKVPMRFFFDYDGNIKALIKYDPTVIVWATIKPA